MKDDARPSPAGGDPPRVRSLSRHRPGPRRDLRRRAGLVRPRRKPRRARSRRAARGRASSPSPPTPAPPSTASTCARSPGDRIQKVDPATGRGGRDHPGARRRAATRASTWAEGTLWVGQYRARKIHQVDPETGAILRTIDSDRFVTGVTWVERRALARHLGGRARASCATSIRRRAKCSSASRCRAGINVSGLESDGAGVFYCGGGSQRQGARRAQAQAPPTTRKEYAWVSRDGLRMSESPEACPPVDLEIEHLNLSENTNKQRKENVMTRN